MGHKPMNEAQGGYLKFRNFLHDGQGEPRKKHLKVEAKVFSVEGIKL